MPSVINATSGALKASSIKTCPDGYEYGYHGDGHWHFAEKRGKQYYAQGEAQYAIENAEINWNNVVQRFAFNAINTNSYTYDELVE